jgi:hypothetical protein
VSSADIRRVVFAAKAEERQRILALLKAQTDVWQSNGQTDAADIARILTRQVSELSSQ